MPKVLKRTLHLPRQTKVGAERVAQLCGGAGPIAKLRTLTLPSWLRLGAPTAGTGGNCCTFPAITHFTKRTLTGSFSAASAVCAALNACAGCPCGAVPALWKVTTNGETGSPCFAGPRTQTFGDTTCGFLSIALGGLAPCPAAGAGTPGLGTAGEPGADNIVQLTNRLKTSDPRPVGYPGLGAAPDPGLAWFLALQYYTVAAAGAPTDTRTNVIWRFPYSSWLCLGVNSAPAPLYVSTTGTDFCGCTWSGASCTVEPG
jgi:hypothetical protein